MIERRDALSGAGKLFVVTAGVLPGIVAGTISVMLPRISDAFGGAQHSLLVKMVVTAASLGMMVGAPAGGILADRIGRRSVLFVSVAAMGLVGVGVLLVTTLWQLIVARLVLGVAAGALTTVYIALIGDAFNEVEQGKWLGLNGAVATLLVVVLNPVTGALVDGGWHRGFLVYAIAFPLLLLVLVGVPREPTHNMTADEAAGEAVIAGTVRLPLFAVVLATVLGMLATGTSLYWPFRLHELGVVSARDLGLYFVPSVAAIAVAAFCYGWLRRFLSVLQVFAWANLLAAVGLAVLAFATSPLMAMAGLILQGAGVGAMTPNISLYAISIAPRHARARIVGLTKGVYFGSPFITQFALEALNGVGGASAALLGIAGTSTALALYLLVRPAQQPLAAV